MLFGRFVSKKKYEDLLDESNRYFNELANTRQYLEKVQIDLDKQVAINEELKSFTDKFKEFYHKVTEIPIITNQLGSTVGLAVSAYIDERSMSYGHMAESLKAQLTSDLAERLTQSGAVKFELVDDRATGRVAYKATIYVHKGG